MSPDIDIQVACDEPVPDPGDLRLWLLAGLTAGGAPAAAEVSLRLVGELEMTRLNRDFRGRNKSTNVLSFPAEFPADTEFALLGDIVICAPVVAREAEEQGKPAAAHWAHMAVHGALHLLGYDHIEDDEAQRMESLETQILADLGHACPYSWPATARQAVP